MKTRDQDFAEKTYKVVSSRINNPKTKQQEYRSFAKRFPTLIHTCGLMQAMAFALAKGGTQLEVLDDFVEVLQGISGYTQKFVEGCQTMDLQNYMHQSHLAMLAAGWIKRQVDALIEIEGE